MKVLMQCEARELAKGDELVLTGYGLAAVRGGTVASVLPTTSKQGVVVTLDGGIAYGLIADMLVVVRRETTDLIHVRLFRQADGKYGAELATADGPVDGGLDFATLGAAAEMAGLMARNLASDEDNAVFDRVVEREA